MVLPSVVRRWARPLGPRQTESLWDVPEWGPRGTQRQEPPESGETGRRALELMKALQQLD